MRMQAHHTPAKSGLGHAACPIVSIATDARRQLNAPALTPAHPLTKPSPADSTMRVFAFLSSLALASAFVAPAPKLGRGRAMR